MGYMESGIIYIISYFFIYIHYNNHPKIYRSILIINNYKKRYIICFFLIYFSNILSEYIGDIFSPEWDSLKILYNLSIIEEYKQEQILHGNFDLLSTILLAPICEEILFRLILLKRMLNYGFSVKKSIFVSSFLFGFSHINLWQCITAFLIGSLIGIIYYRTKSLFFLYFITFFK